MTPPTSMRRPTRAGGGQAVRRRADLLAWAIVAFAFAFGFGLLLQPSGSFVLSPMEHAQRQAEARERTLVVTGASEGLAGAWPMVADGD
jgi:hypothetical protein